MVLRQNLNDMDLEREKIDKDDEIWTKESREKMIINQWDVERRQWLALDWFLLTIVNYLCCNYKLVISADVANGNFDNLFVILDNHYWKVLILKYWSKCLNVD